MQLQSATQVAYGQFCVMIPDYGAVVSITADTGNMQGEINAIWDHMSLGFKALYLPANATQQGNLNQAIRKGGRVGLLPPLH